MNQSIIVLCFCHFTWFDDRKSMNAKQQQRWAWNLWIFEVHLWTHLRDVNRRQKNKTIKFLRRCSERIDFIIHLTSEALSEGESVNGFMCKFIDNLIEMMHADGDTRLINLSVPSVERFHSFVWSFEGHKFYFCLNRWMRNANKNNSTLRRVHAFANWFVCLKFMRFHVTIHLALSLSAMGKVFLFSRIKIFWFA